MSKLVRDRIPEIIERNDGIPPSTHRVTGTAFLEVLNAKLDEEIGELRDAPDTESAMEEIADIIEVLLALAKQKGYAPEQIEAIRLEKQAKR